MSKIAVFTMDVEDFIDIDCLKNYSFDISKRSTNNTLNAVIIKGKSKQGTSGAYFTVANTGASMRSFRQEKRKRSAAPKLSGNSICKIIREYFPSGRTFENFIASPLVHIYAFCIFFVSPSSYHKNAPKSMQNVFQIRKRVHVADKNMHSKNFFVNISVLHSLNFTYL